MKAAKEEDPYFKKVLAFLLASKGFDGHQYKPNYVKRRVAVRMRAVGAADLQNYWAVLQGDPGEASKLLDRLTIHVTEFFRDPEVYRAVREKLLPGLSGLGEEGVHVWCAGCSTGEEPYSVAMMLREWAFDHPGFRFRLLATDIDPASVRTAEKGEYPLEAVQKLAKSQVTRWFHREGSRVRVLADLKKDIRFRVHDLIPDWEGEYAGFHLIFCRNLLIYLNSAQQQRIYERCARALVPGGHLVLGLTETLMGPSRRSFRCVDIRHRIYQALRPGDMPEERMADG